MKLFSVRFGFWLPMVGLLGFFAILRNLDKIVLCGYFFQESADGQPQSLKDVFQGNYFWPGDFSADNNQFEGARENHSSGTGAFQGRNNKQQQREQPGCAHQCGSSGRPNSGRKTRRTCRVQQKWSSSPVFHAVRGCCCSPFSQYGACKSGRRCKRLQLVSWTADSVPNAKGQTKRNQLRYPDLCRDLAGGCTHNLHGGSGSGGVRHDLLMSEHQRSTTGRGKGKGSALYQILVSLVHFYFLFLGDQHSKTAQTVLKKRLLCPLLEPVSTRSEEVYEASQTAKLDSPLQLQWDVSYTSSKLPSCSNKPCGGKHASRSAHSRFEKHPPWLYNSSNLRPQITRLWLAPASSFLPSMTSRDASSLDYLGYRLASLAALPASCPLSRVRVAEAGFHFNPSTNPRAVLCHRCPAVYSLEQAPGAPGPLQVHRETSPGCPVVRALSQRQQGSDTPTSPFASGGNREELSEDSDWRGIQPGATGDSGMTTAFRQPSDSVSWDSGYVLALNGTALDQRNEPTIPDVTATDSASFSASRSSRLGRYDHNRDDPVTLRLSEAVYPQFSTRQSRLSTFTHWPHSATGMFPAQYMADLGFYYAGYADCVRCFYCGVGLKSWEPQDDPLTEHIRWRPECRFLMSTKGKEHVQQILQRINGTSEAVPVSSSSRSGQSSGTSAGPPGRSGSSGAEDTPHAVIQQLITMGFSSKDIDAACDRARNTGHPEDLHHLLQYLP